MTWLVSGRTTASSWGSCLLRVVCFFFSSRRRHTRLQGDWSSDVCSSDLSRSVATPRRSPARSSRYSHRPAWGLLPTGWSSRESQNAPARGSRHWRGRREKKERERGVGGKRGDIRGGRVLKKKKKEEDRDG